MQLETENTEIEDASSVAGWQPCINPQPGKDDTCSDTDICPPSGIF
jgi:hypothetical protein